MTLRPRSCLLLLLLLLLHVALVTSAAADCTNSDPCTLSCDGCGSGVLIPDPSDCRGYYTCLGSGADDYSNVAFDCDNDEVFSFSAQACVSGVTCEECPAAPLSCIYECPATGLAVVPSSMDCGVYYVCSGGDVLITENCDPSTPYFDGTQCQADESRCCSCHPYCSLSDLGEFVPDPTDCRRYYTCLSVGTPEHSTSCNDGEYYDRFSQKCSDKVSCVTECINVIGEDSCIEPYTCLDEGFFAKCPSQCVSEYYRCSHATYEYQEASSCSSGAVFNPDRHTCVSPSYCP